MVTSTLICIADDSADYRSVLQQCLRQHQPAHSVVLFASGDALLAALHTLQQPPSLFLLDVNMPGLSGPQTLARLRQLPGHERTPIILMSATATPAELEACYEAQANYFLQKPTSFALLRQRLDLICRYWLEAHD